MPSTTNADEAPGIGILVSAGLLSMVAVALVGVLTTDATVDSVLEGRTVLFLYLYESVEYVPFAVAALAYAVRKRRGESTRFLVAIPAVLTPLLAVLLTGVTGWLWSGPAVDPVRFGSALVLLGLLPTVAYVGAKVAYDRIPENPTRADLPAVVEPVAGVVLAGAVVVLFLELVVTGYYETLGTVEVAVAAVLLVGLSPLVVPTAVAVATGWLLATTPDRGETLRVGATTAAGVLVAFLVLSTVSDLLVPSGAYFPYETPLEWPRWTSLIVLSVTGLHRLVAILVLPTALSRISTEVASD